MIAAIAIRVARNIAGWVLLAVGAFLFIPFVPGPGFVFLLAGLALADWPGKRRFFRWLHSFPAFERCDRWIHRKLGFRLPEHDHVEQRPESSD